MSRVVLQMEEIAFRRGDAQILHAVDWRVEQGQHWAVLGPNGSGKTTLMMIATGYLPSSAGRTYLVEGYISDIALPDVRERIGFVSAALSDAMVRHYGATEGLRVVLSGRYASLGLYRRPGEGEVREALAVARRLGIEHLMRMRYGLMSTGQRQLCLIARCRMARSELVILDEPCAGLDLAARERLLRALDEGCRLRPHVPQVLVTHHPEEILPSITHVLLLRGGRVVAAGEKEDVLNEENLGETFGLALRLVRQDGRVWVIPR